MARINAVMRRSEGKDEHDSVFEWQDTHIDFDGRMLRMKGETVPLTAQEWEILEFLWKRRAGFVPVSKLRDAVWGDENTTDDAVSAAVSRLRRRLGHAGHLIRSARGIGYAFDGALPPSK
jgi:two-component system copper resistance phosphate regulon response regulator CusR